MPIKCCSVRNNVRKYGSSEYTPPMKFSKYPLNEVTKCFITSRSTLFWSNFSIRVSLYSVTDFKRDMGMTATLRSASFWRTLEKVDLFKFYGYINVENYTNFRIAFRMGCFNGVWKCISERIWHKIPSLKTQGSSLTKWRINCENEQTLVSAESNWLFIDTYGIDHH